MMSINRKYAKMKSYLAPLSFIIIGILQIMLFYLGFNYTVNNYGYEIFIALSIVYGLTCFYHGKELWSVYEYYRTRMILGAFIILLFIIGYISAIIYSDNKKEIFTSLGSFGVFCISAFIMGITASLTKPNDLFLKIERMGMFFLPSMIIYIVINIFNISPFRQNYLGNIDYMSLAGFCLPLLYSSIIIYAKGYNGYANLHKLSLNKYIRLIAIIIFLSAIILSGTRGAIISMFLFIIIYIIYKIIFKEKIIRLLFVGGVAILLIILLPMKSWEKFEFFISNIKNGILASEKESPIDQKMINELVEYEPKEGRDEGLEQIISKIRNRGTLFELAIKEASRRPFCGRGPMGFTNKYGLYPHNFILEILADFGIVVGGIINLFIIFCFIRNFIISKSDFFTGEIMVFLSGFIVVLMVSGTVWFSPTLMFGLGYSICLKAKPRRLMY